MSILINGMEKPENCRLCIFRDFGRCAFSVEITDAICNDTRPDDCPLVELPPHGDLIDRNKLYEKTAEWEAQALHMVEVTMHDEDTTDWRKWSTVLTERSAFKFDVADAPTVIQADVSDNNVGNIPAEVGSNEC